MQRWKFYLFLFSSVFVSIDTLAEPYPLLESVAYREKTKISATESAYGHDVAIFAGGCYWCMEGFFDRMPGVKSTTVGFFGGHFDFTTGEYTQGQHAQRFVYSLANQVLDGWDPDQITPRPIPNWYKRHNRGDTGHQEVVRVEYDSRVVSYRELLAVYWRNIDPLDAGGQFCDRGEPYQAAIFVANDEQQIAAEESQREMQQLLQENPMTPVVRFTESDSFYVADDYHQDYYQINHGRYEYYRGRCGRDERLEDVWQGNDPRGEELTRQLYATLLDSHPNHSAPALLPPLWQLRWMSRTPEQKQAVIDSLTPLQYEVTQEEATEVAGENIYEKLSERGIYVDVVSGEPLFSSMHKYDSGSGWPAFWRRLEGVRFLHDSPPTREAEIKSFYGGSHLGHILYHLLHDDENPRYCINSAAMRFIPEKELSEQGYPEYVEQF